MKSNKNMNRKIAGDVTSPECSLQRLVRLGVGKGNSCAEDVRAFGLKIGDIIVGKEGGDGWWNETRLTLLWIGKEKCVWKHQWRGNHGPINGWHDDGEKANWTLSCREWFLEPNELSSATRRRWRGSCASTKRDSFGVFAAALG